MAVLGAQLVITLVTVSVIQKLSPYYSFARWMLCSTGLTRYLYPTNSELKSLMKPPKKKNKSNKFESSKNGRVEKFLVPKNLDIELDSMKVLPQDIGYLRYFTEFQWLLDFSVYAAIVYTLTELYSFYYPIEREINLSMLWCSLVQLFALKIILSLTGEYFKGPESTGERSTIIVTLFSYLVLVMIILIVDESKLETGLDAAYSNFTTGAVAFLENKGFPTEGPASKIILKFTLAIWSSIIGAFFVFPGLRLARMHWDSLKYCQERRLLQFILHLNFLTPLFLILLWIRPISHYYLTVKIFSGLSEPLLSVSSFESLRVVLIVLSMLLRLSVMPIYLQAYLNMAYDRTRTLKEEAGKITNIDLQKKVASVFIYMCVVALQYIVPLITCLFFCFMYKTLGGFTWNEFLKQNSLIAEAASNVTADVVFPNSTIVDNITIIAEPSVKNETTKIVFDSLSQVFTKDVYRGIFGFATWWSCFSWFLSSCIGLLYYIYFPTMG